MGIGLVLVLVLVPVIPADWKHIIPYLPYLTYLTYLTFATYLTILPYLSNLYHIIIYYLQLSLPPQTSILAINPSTLENLSHSTRPLRLHQSFLPFLLPRMMTTSATRVIIHPTEHPPSLSVAA